MVNFEHQNENSGKLQVYSCCGTTCDRDKSWKETEAMVAKIEMLTDKNVMLMLSVYYMGFGLGFTDESPSHPYDNARMLEILRDSPFIEDETDKTLLRGIQQFRDDMCEDVGHEE